LTVRLCFLVAVAASLVLKVQDMIQAVALPYNFGVFIIKGSQAQL